MTGAALLQRPSAVARAAKVVIAGGTGVGKTTFVETASDISTVITEAGVSADAHGDLSPTPAKQTTTVALDFGRADFDGISLYLFGTPGQPRSWFMWDRIALGALGAVVLADIRRLADCFSAVDYFEHLRLPYIIVINRFDDTATGSLAALRHALAIGSDVPVLVCDGRSRSGTRHALAQLLERMIQVRSTAATRHR